MISEIQDATKPHIVPSCISVKPSDVVSDFPFFLFSTRTRTSCTYLLYYIVFLFSYLISGQYIGPAHLFGCWSVAYRDWPPKNFARRVLNGGIRSSGTGSHSRKASLFHYRCRVSVWTRGSVPYLHLIPNHFRKQMDSHLFDFWILSS